MFASSDALKRKISPAMIILLILLLIAAGITVYSGELPPASVVESDSMEHSNNWTYGTINVGDTVIVKKLASPVSEVITYVQGRQINFSTYGDYGNVILYSDPSGFTVIHRAMFYLSWSHGKPVIPYYSNQSWMKVTSSYVLIKDVGYSHRNLVVYISNFKNESGFITMGDHNLATIGQVFHNKALNAYEAADQNVGIIGHPVYSSEVLGKAVGQIPWFGLIKLNLMRLEGQWPYYNEVPNHSYEYLAASMIGILVAIFFPYSIFSGGKGKRKS